MASWTKAWWWSDAFMTAHQFFPNSEVPAGWKTRPTLGTSESG
jgi:hypothetical protein